MFLGWKEMRNSAGRYLGIVALITLITYLVFFLTGLAYGLAQANRTSLDNFKADGMVISAYANDSVIASRIAPDALATDLEAVAPLSITQVVITDDERELKDEEDPQFNASLFGINLDSFIAPEIIEGSAPAAEDEAVIAESMAENRGVAIGHTLKVAQSDLELKVVGIARDAKFQTSPVIYTALADAQGARQPAGSQAPPPGAVAEKISGYVINAGKAADFTDINSRDEGLIYLAMEDLIWAIPGYSAQELTFGLMIGFLVVICAIVIGIFMYILTMQKKPIFGVLKAQGISTRYIAVSVLWQTAVVTWAGLGIGAALTGLTAAFLPAAVPFLIDWRGSIIAAIMIFLVAGVGAQLSVRQVAKIDPLEAME